MNLTDAQKWLEQCACHTNPNQGLIDIDLIRQIQADALRFAAQKAIERGDPILFHAFTLEANQLHPIREEKKLLNMNPGVERSKCCNGTVSIEGGLHGTHWYSCNACGEPCDLKHPA